MEYNLKSIFVKAVDLLRMTAGDKKRPNGNYYADEALMTIEKIKHKY